MKNTLTVLGGANIGGSCYLLELEGARLLFDCGTKPQTSYTGHPDIPSPETIDAIFISHSHIDHMGCIAYAAAVCPNARIFTTPTTRDFLRYQLADVIAEYIGADSEDLRFSNELLCRLVLNRIETVPYQEKKQFSFVSRATGQTSVCRFSFFPAGHIPGAAMTYLRIGSGPSFLYTGDFYMESTPMTEACRLPQGLHPDVLLLCGTYAHRLSSGSSTPSIAALQENIVHLVNTNRRLLIHAGQLTKGLETLTLIDDLVRDRRLYGCSVYMDDSIWQLARYYEVTGADFRLPSYMHPLNERTGKDRCEIVLLSQAAAGTLTGNFPTHHVMTTNFTLHARGPQLVSLVKTLAPRTVFLVHTAPHTPQENALADALSDSGITVIDTVNERTYCI